MPPKALVRDALKELGLAASKERGQNFLKDEKVVADIVRAVRQEAGEAEILEIGPGLGALTFALLEAGAKVTAVEFDRGLAENLKNIARAEYQGRLTIIHQDVLTLDPAPLAENGGGPLFVCGNLPYNISSPLLLWFVGHLNYFSGALFMLQKEMAERLVASPAARDYGRLTVALALWCRARKLFLVPPSAFHPRPTVESAVIALAPRPDAETAALKVSKEALGRFTAAAFAARRKTIFNNLSKVYGRDKAAAALERNCIAPGLRAETLAPEQLAALAERLEHDFQDLR